MPTEASLDVRRSLALGDLARRLGYAEYGDPAGDAALAAFGEIKPVLITLDTPVALAGSACWAWIHHQPAAPSAANQKVMAGAGSPGW